MRSISFSLTERQFLNGSKDITRRTGWTKLKSGEQLKAVRQTMGLTKGEKQHQLGVIEVVSVRREPLDALLKSTAYAVAEVRREGFQPMTGEQFVAFFCASHRGCKPSTIVTRIEFRRIA
ncbi:MAG: hypothetical protein QM715_03630 [Nibricoccus sp.]